MICVYPSDCTDFSTNGLGVLSPLTATVTETLNGEYELELVHPIDEHGKWRRLVEGCILRAPVPASMTPRANIIEAGDDNRTEIWRVNTDISTAELRKGTLRLRSGPGTSYKVLANYKRGSLVQIIAKPNSSWYEVTAPDGKHGYMSTKYLVYDHTEGSVSGAISAVVEPKQLRDQPFRIYRIVPELDKITVYARHIFYDLLDNMIQSYKPGDGVSGATVVRGVSSSCLSDHDFTFYSDITATADEVEFENKNPVDALLGEDGVVEKYAGELARDWFDVYVVQCMGVDSNVQIRQAKNLTGIQYDVDLTDVVTRIMPTGEDKDGNILYLPELFIDNPLSDIYPHPKWIHLAVSDAKESDDKEEPKTKAQCYTEMRGAVQEQFDAGCDIPTITLTVDFVNCADTEEYREYGFLQNIYLGDAVRVIAPRVGVEVSMRMTQYTYDCLTKKYTAMTLGTVADTVEGNTISARQLPSGIITGSKLAINSVGVGQLQSGSVGSLQIQNAAVQTAHIEDAAITKALIANAAIGTAQIEDAAVTRAKIGSAAVGTAQIEEASITKAKIGQAAVGTAQIEDAAITSAKIGSGEIQQANIADASITTAKIVDGAVKNAKIEDAAVSTAKIQDAAITNAKIGGAAVGTANIQDAAIVDAKILDGEIVTAKIADLAVTGAKIANLAVTTAKIANAAITNAQIANAAVNTAQIALGAITQALIVQGAVGTAQIADASITSAKVVSLNADVITSGTLATERLIITGDDGVIYEINAESSGLSLAELSDQKYREKLNGTVLVARSITAEQIAAATITANEILAGTITGDKIAANTIEGSNIKAGAITTSHVSSNFGQTLDLSSNTGIKQRVQRIYDDMEAAIAAVGGGEVIVGTQTAATASWTGVASFDALTDGQQIVYWLPYAGATNVMLNLTLSDGTTTGEIPVYYSGTTRLSTHYPAGNAIRLIYKVNAPIGASTYTGWWADANYDSGNTYDRIRMNNAVTAKTAVTAGHLIVGDSVGYYHMAAGASFDVNKPILYAASAIAATKTATTNYLCYPSINLRTTLGDNSWTATKTKTCYLVGTLSGQTFTVAASGWLTTNPADATGTLVFISLGFMYSTYQLYLYPEHPMFRMVNGTLTAVSQMAYEASEAIANLEIGGRNYVLDSGVETSGGELLIASYNLSEDMVSGDEYTLSVCFTPDAELVKMRLYTSGGNQLLAEITPNGTGKQTAVVTFTASYAAGHTPGDDPANGDIQLKRSAAASSDESETTVYWVMLERGNRASDYRPAPEDAEESLELKLASVHAQITNEGDSIRQEVQATYALASDMTRVREQVGTLTEQTESNYIWSVTQINQLEEDVATAREATEAEMAVLRTYMTFGDDGLVIGKTGNPFTFRVVNDRLVFYMNDTEVAYLSNNKLYVTQAEILTKLIIGKFAFEPQTNGNLSLIYVG